MFPRGIPRSSKDGAYGSPCALDGLLLGTCGNPTPPWRRGLPLHSRLRCDSDCNGFVPRRNTAACEPSRWDIARYVSALRSGRRWLSSRKGSTAAPAQAACGDRAILRVVVAFGVRRAARTARRFLFKGYVISISIPPRERLGAERSYDAGELISELLEDRSSHGSLGSSVFAAWSLGLQGSGRENRVAVVLRSL